jgi:3alpha(or 20beta)-hydroxysteroid dehydrogenase
VEQTVLVVGAACGVGAAHARKFHAKGARVVIGDVYDYEGFALANELGERARFVHLDPTNRDHWHETLRVAEQQLGKISLVIDIAGQSEQLPDAV